MSQSTFYIYPQKWCGIVIILVPIWGFPRSNDASITQTATFSYLKPSSIASGIAAALVQNSLSKIVLKFPQSSAWLMLSTLLLLSLSMLFSPHAYYMVSAIFCQCFHGSLTTDCTVHRRNIRLPKSFFSLFRYTVFRYDMNSDTLIFGGIATYIWIWSLHTRPSIRSTCFISHSFLMIATKSFLVSPYIIFLLYFGIKTIW